MEKLFIFLLLIPLFGYAQINRDIKVVSKKTGLPLRNVNILVPNIDSTFITNEDGIANIVIETESDILVFKKFGYQNTISIINTVEITLTRDTSIYSHNLKLVDLKHRDGYSYILINIDEQPFWFKQKIGPLRIANGVELETGQDFFNIFSHHDILKTISVQSERCLYGFIGENYANAIMAIYFNPQKNKKSKKYIPSTTWYNKKRIDKDLKTMKLQGGCLD